MSRHPGRKPGPCRPLYNPPGHCFCWACPLHRSPTKPEGPGGRHGESTIGRESLQLDGKVYKRTSSRDGRVYNRSLRSSKECSRLGWNSMLCLVDARIIVENLVVDSPVFCPGDPADTEIPTHLAQTDYSPQGLYCILYRSSVFTTEAVLFPAGAIFCPDGAALYVAGVVLCTTGVALCSTRGSIIPHRAHLYTTKVYIIHHGDHILPLRRLYTPQGPLYTTGAAL